MGIEIKQEYIDRETGEMILRLINIDTDKKTFIGKAKISKSIINPVTGEHGVQGRPLDFEIKAKSIKEAFKNYGPELKRIVKEIEDAMNAPKIEIPNQNTAKAINADSKLRLIK